MKKYILIALMAVLAFNANAQKLEKPMIDKLTGDTTWETSQEKISSNMQMMSLSQENLYLSSAKIPHVGYCLTFKILNANGITVFSINKGNRVYLKLSDKTIDTLINNLDVISETDVKSSSNVVGTAYVLVILNKDNRDRLKSATVELIRFETSKGNFDYEIKPKNSAIINKEIGLIESK